MRTHKTHLSSLTSICSILGDTSANGGKNAKDPLYIAIRAQANFLENVPIAMITALLAELNGGDRYVLHGSRLSSSAFTYSL
jgi:hypothetical protein